MGDYGICFEYYEDRESISSALYKYEHFAMILIGCRLENLDIIKMADKSEIDINSDGGVIIKTLCANGNFEILKYIVQEFKDLDMYKNINIFKYIACENANLNIFKYLMSFSKEINLYKDMSGNEGGNVCGIGSGSGLEFLYCLNCKNTDILKYLVDNNYIEITDDLFLHCCNNSYYNIVKYLIDNFKNRININIYKYDTNTSMLLDYIKIIEYLVDNCIDSIDVDLLLIKLIKLCNIGSLKKLNNLTKLIIFIMDNFNIDINKHTDIFLQNYSVDILKYIIDKSNINIHTNYYYFLSACKNREYDIVKYIIETYNNVDITKNDYEAFKATFDSYDTLLTKYLLEKYNDKNMIDLYETYNTNNQYSYTNSKGHIGYYYPYTGPTGTRLD